MKVGRSRDEWDSRLRMSRNKLQPRVKFLPASPLFPLYYICFLIYFYAHSCAMWGAGMITVLLWQSIPLLGDHMPKHAYEE